MEVKEAVQLAVEHISILFENEELTNIGLEEVEYNPETEEWIVTIGFSRPWDYPKNFLANLSANNGMPYRSFKVVTISEYENKILSVKNRTSNG